MSINTGPSPFSQPSPKKRQAEPYRKFADFYDGNQLIGFVDLAKRPDGTYYFNVIPNYNFKFEVKTTGESEARDRIEETERHANIGTPQRAPRIAAVEPSRFDPFEQEFYGSLSGTPQHRVEVMINTVDRDRSQMSPYLQSLADKLGM